MPTSKVTTPDGNVIEVQHPAGASQAQIIQYAQANYKPKGSIGKTVAGLGADIAISEGGRMAGAATGAAIGTAVPVVGTAIGAGVGYIVGGLGSGAAGSIARQRINDPDADISWGSVVADSLINLVPGGKAIKGAKTGARVAKSLGKGAAYGAGLSTAGGVVESAIDEGSLPTLEELAKRGLTGAVLGGGLGVTGEALSTAYAKFAGMPTRHFDEALRKGDPDAKMIVDGVEKSVSAQREAVNAMYREKMTAFQERHSDEHIRGLLLQDQSANQRFNKEGVLKVVRDDEDYYLQRRLAEGKIQSKHQAISELGEADNEFLYRFAKQSDQDPTALSKKVDDYLQAQHGLDYNKRLGDGAAGVTNDVAKRRIRAFEKADLDKDLAIPLDIRRKQSAQILDELVQGGLIAKETAAGWRKTSPSYVPLNRIMEGLDDASTIDNLRNFHVGKKEVRSTGQFKAKGSELAVNVRENIYNNLVSSVKRAEVNKANIAFKKLLAANPDNPVATVTGFNPKTDNRDSVMTVFENGKKYAIKFNDTKIAAAFKGANKKEMGALLQAMRGAQRFLGKTLTMWNPLGFTVPNVARDRSEAFVNALSKMRLKDAAQTLNPARVGSDMRVIASKLLKRIPRTDKDKELFALYDEFKQHGGSTGGLALTTIKDVEKNISELTKHMNSPTRRKARKLNEIMSGINEVAEDATRFGAYRQGLASGMTKDQAALAARDSSFDPMLKGTEMDVISALYLFANPAVQSGKNFIRSMKNPKVGLSVMAGLTALSMGLDKWNSMMDPEWRSKLKDKRGSEWKNNKNLIFVTGTNDDGTIKYASIPIGYSMVPFKLAADRAQQFVTGQDVGDPLTLGKEMAGEILDSYNPTGGSIVPTLIRPATEIAANKDALGREIKPFKDTLMDEIEKVYPWTAQTKGGEIAMGLAESLHSMGYDVSPENLIYLYEFGTGGVGRQVSDLMNVSSKMFNGEKISPRDIPVLKRFYGETYVNSWETRTGELQDIRNLEKQENTTSARSKRIAIVIADAVSKAAPKDRRRVMEREISSTEGVDQAVLRKLGDILTEKAMGIDYTDKSRRNLGVKNGARAMSFVQTLEKMPKENIAMFIRDQRRKRILTPEVEKQMASYQQFRGMFKK
jgi:hypothetical protein